MKRQGHRFLLFTAMVILSSCLSQKKFPEGKYFLKKNIIQKNEVRADNEEIKAIIKQKPNRKILGIMRLHLGMYNLGNSGDTTVGNRKGLNRFWSKTIKRQFLRNNGEEPVFLDSTLTQRSVKQLNIYLQKKGYFNSQVTDSVIIHKRKATVVYSFIPNKPYTIRNLSYSTKDDGLDSLLQKLKSTSLILSGKKYDEAILDEERDRLTAEIRDHGYYFFNKNYITFEPDSSLKSHEVDIYLYVHRLNEDIDPSLKADNPEQNHHAYKINRVSIFTNYDAREQKNKPANDTALYDGYYFISDLKTDYISKNSVLHTVFVRKGNLFLQREVDHTYSRLADLGVFKFINFKFREVPRDDMQRDYLLDVYIQLTPIDKQEYKLESELTHNGGNLGVAGSLSYLNKNIFHGAETFELKLSGGLEALRNFADTSVADNKLFFFNSFDIGPEANLGFKRFLLPGFIKKGDSTYFSPRTFISTGFNYQERPDFKRSIVKLSYNLGKRVSQTFRYQFYLFEINSVTVNLDPEFSQKLFLTGDKNLIYSYRNHLITSGHVSFIYSNQTTSKTKDFTYLRTTFESAGLSLWAFRKYYGIDSAGKHYVLGLKFSQYVKGDIDFSFHQWLDASNTMVYRLAGGFGYSYLNSKDELLPFDKAFFAGGANDIRAWQARTLGPGSYTDPQNIENGGDIKIEANIEYRSVIFKILEAAAFVDAGNVWIRNDHSGALPGAEFDLKKVPEQTAIGAGIGFRFNFTFFIIRTDFALKIRNPALDISDRWVYGTKKFVIGDIVPNLAIGYPF